MRRRKRSRPALAAGPFAVLLTAMLGCGGAEGYRVTGTVNVDGQPVPLGIVNFAPDRQQGNEGSPVMARIEDGEIVPGDHLVAGGPHWVNISCYDGVPYKSDLQIIGTGKPLLPPQAVAVDLPMANAELIVEIRTTSKNQYEIDVDVR